MCYSLLKGTLKDNLPTKSEVLEIYGKIIVNGLKILDGNMSNVGHGLYIGTSILDHSCAPNAQWHHRLVFSMNLSGHFSQRQTKVKRVKIRNPDIFLLGLKYSMRTCFEQSYIYQVI